MTLSGRHRSFSRYATNRKNTAAKVLNIANTNTKERMPSCEIGLSLNSYLCNCEKDREFGLTINFDFLPVLFGKERVIVCEILLCLVVLPVLINGLRQRFPTF